MSALSPTQSALLDRAKAAWDSGAGEELLVYGSERRTAGALERAGLLEVRATTDYRGFQCVAVRPAVEV